MRSARHLAISVKCPICSSNENVFSRKYRPRLPATFELFSGVSIRTCQNCLVSFADPMPPPDNLTSYYSEIYRCDGAWHRINREPGPWDGPRVRARSQVEFLLAAAAKSCNPDQLKSWLDVGAGYGWLLDLAVKHGIQRTGAVEPDKYCRNRLIREKHEVYDHLSETGGRWDIISFSHVLEHLASPRPFLSQVYKQLSPNGYVFCEVPNVVDLDRETNDAPHLLFFTIPSITALFENSGFTILRIESCGPKSATNTPLELTRWLRRIAIHIFDSPPPLIDRMVHPHFSYSAAGTRAWIRLIAQKTVDLS